MTTQDSSSISSFSTVSSSVTEQNESKLRSLALNNSSPSMTRLWRPAAQLNLKNQWLKLVSQNQQWAKASSSGRSHLTSLVNSYLSQRYMGTMDSGVLSNNMPNIRQRACQKLARQQELHRRNLFSCYKDLVMIVSLMTNISSSMRCFVKGPAGSPLIQFSCLSEDKNDFGDGGGLSVYTFWSIMYFENLAKELIQMFGLELMFKRLLVFKFITINCEASPRQTDKIWSDELYSGEFEDLRSCQLFSEENCQPIFPKSNAPKALDLQPNKQLSQEDLEVRITAWFVEYNIDEDRVANIFKIVGEEMHFNLS
ncbi:hypothetical protein Scep_002774 [Stephania cephalantha]|uniref:Uncharacterized protein n=1 Tax=Stephania cephalantha TaxID=152367 RepID=A0AAP0LBU6_9MAGN